MKHPALKCFMIFTTKGVYFFISLLIGAVWSLMISYLYTIFELNTVPWIEIGFFILTSYTPYILSEALGCSGILSILISGLLMRNYAYYSLSPFGNVTIDYLTECLGIMSENFIFAYVGISVPLMINDVSLSYVLIGIIALVTSRYLSVAIVSLVVNQFKEEKIPFSHQLVMTIGGLRGAVAFYLALNVSSEYKHLIITTTISLILFTVIGMGSATPFMIKILNKAFPEDKIIVNLKEDEIPLNQAEKSDNAEKLESFKDNIPEPQSPQQKEQIFSGISYLEKLDKKYLQRFFRKDGWAYYLEGRAEMDNDVQLVSKEAVKRMTNNYGDLSPHRISNLVNNEIQHRMLDSSIKDNNGRALTPPTRKQAGVINAEMNRNTISPKDEYNDPNNPENQSFIDPEAQDNNGNIVNRSSRNQLNGMENKQSFGNDPQQDKNEDSRDNGTKNLMKEDIQ